MLRLGIAGIGAIAGDYIGLIVGGKVRDVALTALCSRNEAHIREAAQRHGLQAAAFTDYGAMLRSGQVDAILICTPHAQHPEMTRQALEAGLHVLVEKPVGIFADEVAEILPVLAERPELVCGVMYNRRAAQAYRHVKNLVQSGELGELVRCSWIITNLYRTEAYYTSGAWRGTWQGEGGGLLMTQASHQLDLRMPPPSPGSGYPERPARPPPSAPYRRRCIQTHPPAPKPRCQRGMAPSHGARCRQGPCWSP